MLMVVRLSALPPPDRMGVVEADQPLAVRSVQRERVVDAVRLLRRRKDPCYDRSNPMASFGVNEQNLPLTCPSRSRRP